MIADRSVRLVPASGTALTALAVLCVLLTFMARPAWGAILSADHDLRVTMHPATRSITGVDSLTLRLRDQPAVLLGLNPEARIEAVSLNGAAAEYDFADGGLRVIVPEAVRSSEVELRIAYTCVFDDPVPKSPFVFDNPGFGVGATITTDAAFLLAGSGWYPRVKADQSSVSLAFTAPRGIYAVTSGALVGHEDASDESISRWRVERLARDLALAAGRYVIDRSRADGGDGREVQVLTYFGAANAELSQRYLVATAAHIEDYAELHGPYAFPKFAVVENFFPTGYGFPSFTLLGGRVLRLPFIPEVSLRHEVAHCWWGNGVLVDYAQGNWSEGLTTYVADYLAKERESALAGLEYRRQVLRDFALLAAGDDFPLVRFTSRVSPATRTVGYGKAMFVFHMLRRWAGDEAFWSTLRNVYAERLFVPTSWNDFRRAFVSVGNVPASAAQVFFEQWLMRPGAPKLTLDGVSAVKAGGGWRVTGQIVQQGEPYMLRVPVRLITVNGDMQALVLLNGSEAEFVFDTIYRPLRVEADPEAEVFRLLEPSEVPSTVNSVKGAGGMAAVFSAGLDKNYLPVFRLLLDSLGQSATPILLESELPSAGLEGRDVFYFGFPDSESGRRAAGAVQDGSWPLLDQLSEDEALALAAADASFAVYKNPEDGRRFSAFFTFRPGMMESDVEVAARKITHYGKYSYLGFNRGRNTAKGVWEPEATPLAVSLQTEKQ